MESILYRIWTVAFTCVDSSSSEQSKQDDSALLWSCDKGVAEFQSRRENRAQRASQALASVDDVKTEITDRLKDSADGNGES